MKTLSYGKWNIFLQSFFTRLHHFARCPRRAALHSQMLYSNIHRAQRCWLAAFHTVTSFTFSSDTVHCTTLKFVLVEGRWKRCQPTNYTLGFFTHPYYQNLQPVLLSSLKLENLPTWTYIYLLEININTKKTSLKLRSSPHSKKHQHFMEWAQEMSGSYSWAYNSRKICRRDKQINFSVHKTNVETSSQTPT